MTNITNIWFSIFLYHILIFNSLRSAHHNYDLFNPSLWFIYGEAYIFMDRTLLRMVIPLLTTSVCRWSMLILGNILSRSSFSFFLYNPVTPIITGIRSTFSSFHSLLMTFLNSVYFKIFLWVVLVIEMSPVIPTFIIFTSFFHYGFA